MTAISRALAKERAKARKSPGTTAAERSASGAAAQKHGTSAENVVVQHYHAAALRAGVADMWKIPTPTSRRKDRTIVYIAQSRTDCAGIMLDGSGRFVAEEIKSFGRPLTKKGQSPFRLSEVKAHQAAFLERVMNSGGVAVLTLVDVFGAVYQLPWAEVRKREILEKKKTLTLAEVKPFKVSVKGYMAVFARPKTPEAAGRRMRLTASELASFEGTDP